MRPKAALKRELQRPIVRMNAPMAMAVNGWKKDDGRRDERKDESI